MSISMFPLLELPNYIYHFTNLIIEVLEDSITTTITTDEKGHEWLCVSSVHGGAYVELLSIGHVWIHFLGTTTLSTTEVEFVAK